MPPRALASGTISFGLVAIPIKLYTTSESSKSVRFNMLHKKCGTRLKYRYYCPTDDEFVEREDIAKGYEFAKGQYVLFSQEELKALEPDPTHAIEIAEFIPISAIDPIYFEKSYYLGPDKGGAKPYRLLSETMRQSERAAVAKYAAKGKSHLVLLRPYEGGLVMQQLRYADELRSFSEVPIDEAEVKKQELNLAKQLVEQSAAAGFDPEQYEDEVRKRMWELIERKVQGKDILAAPEESPKAQVIDLMAALKASLGDAKSTTASKRKPPKRAARKPAASSARKSAKRAASRKKK